MTCTTCLDPLNEALNLAARSDQIEEQHRLSAQLAASMDSKAWQESGRFDAFVERHNATTPRRQIAIRALKGGAK